MLGTRDQQSLSTIIQLVTLAASEPLSEALHIGSQSCKCDALAHQTMSRYRAHDRFICTSGADKRPADLLLLYVYNVATITKRTEHRSPAPLKITTQVSRPI